MQPIYCTGGEWVAVLHEHYLYDPSGEWIGFVDGKEVYTLGGVYVGFVTDDFRVVRERASPKRPRHAMPPAPPRIRPPATVPLAPMFSELPWRLIDVFDVEPEIFRRVALLRADWDR
jgi:hypothetical protein